MNRLTHIIRMIHRVLGTLLSILFLVWFLSGIVMIYHTFPRVSQTERRERLDILSSSDLPSIDSLGARLSYNDISSLTLNSLLGERVFHAKGKKACDILADTTAKPQEVNWDYISRIASKWNSAAVESVDTMYTLDQWIPFGRLKQEFPIYRFHFADNDKHQLYLSSRTGEALQYTSRMERFWGWIGAVPHWVYFTNLRQDLELWKKVVIWLSGIGCVMCFAGLYLGVRDFVIARRRGEISPYKKFWYRWHHIVGIIFGLFVLTFCFSGLMSLASVQDMGIKPKLEVNPMQRLRAMAPSPADYPLDYRSVIESYPNSVKELEWGCVGDIPYYVVYTSSSSVVIDARNANEVKPLELTEEDVMALISKIHDANSIDIELLTEYDTYYISRRGMLKLPVWKVSIDDVDNSCYYINPKTGKCRYYNNTARMDHWAYKALHTLSFRFLVNNSILWYIVMWAMMLAGSFISLSGVWLGIKYLRRQFK